LCRFYKRYLSSQIMAFWAQRTLDPEYGGYIVAFGREGAPLAFRKNMWCHGRQLWTFAHYYRMFEPSHRWIELAQAGRDFIVKHAYKGEGRWHYLLDRDGSVLEDAGSAFTDAFVLAGLCEFAAATESREDLPLIESTFNAFERNLQDPCFAQWHHFPFEPGFRYHGPHMVGAVTCTIARQVLGSRVDALSDYCLDMILNTFARDEYGVVFETLAADGSVLDTPAGRTINPGHALESGWFCFEEGLERGDRGIVERAAEIIRWSYEKGVDREQGGILAFVDPDGNPPPDAGLGANAWGEAWDDKIWWVHSEGMYAVALAALELRDEGLFAAFEAVHDFTQRCFADPDYGEWYSYLHRDGSVKEANKGNWIRCAFHGPRGLMKLVQLLERHAPETKE
jgi:N-acylglucosamine 2-epimerase